MNLNCLDVTIHHVKGSSITLTDFGSRNPIEYIGKNCQVCQFVQDNINSSTVEDFEKGLLNMPIYNKSIWREAQMQDSELKRTFSQLSAGTRPGKKEKIYETFENIYN